MTTIRSSAPIRICDNGGWTDTWFARRGRVFSIAVSPRVHVGLQAVRDGRGTIEVRAENYGVTYQVDAAHPAPDAVPLIDAAVAELPPPAGVSCRIAVASEAPAGASTGTSASVAVALLGALARLRGDRLAPGPAARLAHQLETVRLGQQSGVQDQLAAAYGGVNLIDIDPYPEARVWRLPLTGPVALELERRLALVYLGRGHASSAVHDAVIAALEAAGPDAPPLGALREAAAAAADAVVAGDLDGLGRAMRRNTDAQRRLHAELVCADAERLIAIAEAHGAAGWKVNGAGGDGGSLAILGSPDAARRDAMVRAMTAASPLVRVIPVALAPHGLRVGTIESIEEPGAKIECPDTRSTKED